MKAKPIIQRSAAPNTIPSSTLKKMKEAKMWLLWKKGKVPYYTSGQARSKTDTPEDREKLKTYDEALNTFKSKKGYEGVGFALGKDGDGYWQGVDLDDIEENELEYIGDALPGYVETSPSGNGIHAIGYGGEFKALGSNKSGVEAYCKGRFFTFSNKQIRDEPLTNLSTSIDEMLRPIHSPDVVGPVYPPESLISLDSIDNATLNDLQSALKHLDSNEYSLWIKLGYSLKALGDAGLNLWLEWSEKSDKFDEVVAIKKWQTLNGAKSTYKTVFAEAQAAGWKNPQSTNARGISELATLLKNCVYVQQGDKVADLRKPSAKSLCTLSEFKNRYANYRILSGDEKTVPAATAWLQHKERLSAEGSLFNPSEIKLFKDAGGFTWLNTYSPPNFPITSATAKLDIFNAHMEYLLPIKNERDWFISWLAFNVQYPDRRCKVTPLHVSVAHGVGRGWVVDLLTLLVGYLKKTTIKGMIESQFQNFMHESLIVAVEEVKEDNKRYSVADKLRGILTEDFQEVNLKYGATNTTRVHCNYFFMTNHRDALVLPPEDRRINVLTGPEEPNSSEYYTKLYDWLNDDEALSQLYCWLNRRPLTNFNFQTSMKTPARTHMVEGGFSEAETLFRDFKENPPFDAMSTKQVADWLNRLTEGDHEVDTRQIAILLGRYFNRHKIKVKMGMKLTTPRVWCFKKLTIPEIKAAYLQAEKTLEVRKRDRKY